ncbi:NADH-quinone oxidoreductase subunit C [Enorma burkinafasonensis]|uniref:NADH-quinone oxidoreductase subunit C n=1 Tax=Enorma burkinafasonensis TaxID=2590867 RepID=UPI00119D6B9C|nr:NADH-quinone oxidoreductase subunit C [Enorma burkinafasonensis]
MYTTEFTEIPLGELLGRVQSLKHQGMRFIQMCAETTAAGIDLVYTFYDETCDNALNLCVYGIDKSSEVPSIQGLYFAAFSYENETHDLYGVRFINMKLDFGGNFFNVASEEPMTVITPELKAEREKMAKQKAAAAAKARKAAEEAQAAEADSAAGAKAAAADAGERAGAVADKADPAAAAADDRAAKMEAKLAAMDPEKAAKVRAALAAKAAKAAAKDGE